jgi:ribosomal-protein-alanine N-acetyltransferase
VTNGKSDAPDVVIERMELEDLAQVRRIEKASFPVPWPRNSYRREILDNHRAWYLVVRRLDAKLPPEPPPRPFPLNLLPRRVETANDVVAFAGLWLMMDEAHITTVAVEPHNRRRGLGEALIIEMAKLSQLRGAERMTLEVRMSNRVAQSLYRKYGFTDHGVRPRYYSDDLEDALIMWSEPIDGTDFRQRLVDNERELATRLCWTARI